jgi:hypothetical protein
VTTQHLKKNKYGLDFFIKVTFNVSCDSNRCTPYWITNPFQSNFEVLYNIICYSGLRKLADLKSQFIFPSQIYNLLYSGVISKCVVG